MSDEREMGPSEALAEAGRRMLAQLAEELAAPFEPYDLLAEPKAYVIVQPGWGERLAELAPRVPDYCNVCGNFPCLGGHPAP